MANSIASQSFSTSFAGSQGLQRLVQEITAFVGALLNPGRVIAEVHAMRELQLEADRIEAAQPVRAAMLRKQAARIGLR